MEAPGRFAIGDVVLVRSVCGRRTFPRRVVAEPRLALHVCPGTPGTLMRRADALPSPPGRENRRPDPAWPVPQLPDDWHVV